ncbi:MAG: hypothetical protein MZV63_25825 [Marinilabiliales bacterium]|nr:hypothetical protein [Marinilabiliales bacterium]
MPEGLHRGPAEPLTPLSSLEARKRILGVCRDCPAGPLFDLLAKAGATIVERLAFPDHYPYPSGRNRPDRRPPLTATCRNWFARRKRTP